MKKLHLIGFIVLGIVTSNLQDVNCCKTHRSHRHHKKLSTLDDKEKRSSVDLHYDNANSLDGNSPETDHVNTLSDLVKGLTLETSRKIKRNTPDFQNVPPHDVDENSNNNKTVPHTLIATLAHNDDNTDLLSDNRKIKRAPSDKPRLVRDRKYMCHCEETMCSAKDCLYNQVQKYPNTNADENVSAEVLGDTNLIQKTADEPKKFNIPFANNVNFDQRVIKCDPPQPPPNTYFPIYPNPQVYHYTPYTAAHPGLVYTGVTPEQQTYAPAAGYNKFPSPSPIPAHLLKLWQNGAKNLMPVDNNNNPKKDYIPNYSPDGNKKECKECSKVTTPRQVDNSLYWQNHGYSTDFSHKHPHYTTEVVDANVLKLTPEKPENLQYGNPTTMNYAPSYYATKPTTSQEVLNYQHDAHYDYNSVHTNKAEYHSQDNSAVHTNKADYHSQEETNSKELSIEVDKVTHDHKYSAHAMSVIPNDADLQAYSPPPPAPKPYNQPPVIQPPAWYNIENANPSSHTEINVPHRATTLEDVNNGYTNHYNPQKTATLRNANNYKVSAPATEPDSMEKLYRGIEKLILNNITVSDTPQTQAIDERPMTVYENTYRNPDTAVVKNAVKKVLNNFVPGKSEDLLANYGTERSYELAKHNAETLSPDLTNTQQVLKNLLNVPEVENMIVETTNNLINQVMGKSIPEYVIKDTLRNVVQEIPRPTTPPPKRDTLKFEIRMAKRLPRYDESTDIAVFEKIKSIINKSKLGDEATHPLAQNLIVKTVKHSIDKEKGVADEAAIRRAFNRLVKPKRPGNDYNNGYNNGYNKGAPQDVYAPEDSGYKLAPAVPVTERRLQGGVWVETKKDIVENKVSLKSSLEEIRRKEFEKHLDTLQKYNVKPNATYENSPYLQKSEVTPRQVASNSYDASGTADPKNIQYKYPQGNNKYPIIPIVTTINYDYHRNPKQQMNYDNKNPSYSYSTTQNPSYSYSTTQNPSYSYSTTKNPSYSYSTTQNPSYSYSTTKNPSYSYSTTKNPSYSYSTAQNPTNDRLNLLVDSTADQKADGEPYMGRLVPVSPINADGDSSNLVWVGDGVKLPLTMRKMYDGSFALTLSDEICKKFVYKKCPCCLPDGKQGVIMRERRNDESDYEDAEKSKKEFTTETPGNYRVRRDSSEATTLKTFSNAIGKNDFEDADYDSTEENNDVRREGYTYQRYANEDRIISGRARALGNMLKWIKDIVTEAREKRQRRKSADKH